MVLKESRMIMLLFVIFCGVMRETSPISIVPPCGGGNGPCPKNFELGPLSSLRGKPSSYKIRPSMNVKGKGLIESVNVTTSKEPKKTVVVMNASKARDDVAEEIFNYHCDEGEYLFEQAKKTWMDEFQQVLPTSCRITTGVNDTAVHRHQSVAKYLEKCIQDLGKLVKVSSAGTTESVKTMVMTQQAFVCCAEKAGGGSCKIDSTSASNLASAVTASEPEAEEGDPVYVTCKKYCHTSPYFKNRVNQRHRVSRRDQESSDLTLELRNIFGNFDSSNNSSANEIENEDIEFVPPEETVYFAGCIQGCMGRLADAKNPKLSQIGCENYVEPMPCRRHDLCRWNENRKLCLGLVRRCDRYCDYVKDEVDAIEYIKYDQRVDKPVAKKRWYRACLFGCNLKQEPDGKIRAKDPCHVEICEDDPRDLLVNEVFDCSVLMSISEGECETRLNSFTRTRELRHVKILDVCPNSCGACSRSRFSECSGE